MIDRRGGATMVRKMSALFTLAAFALFGGYAVLLRRL